MLEEKEFPSTSDITLRNKGLMVFDIIELFSFLSSKYLMELSIFCISVKGNIQWTGAASMENIMEVAYKTKNAVAI